MKVAITTSSFAQYDDAPLRLLRDNHLQATLNPHGRVLSEDEAIELLQGCVGVAAGSEPLSAKALAALPDLKVISRCGVGLDSVDLEAARQRGIVVKNTPDAATQAVVELTLGLALDMLRQISRMDRELRSGVWKKRMGNLLQGKKLGLVGYGRIGQAVAKAFLALGAEVCFFDPAVKEADYPRRELNSLLSWADIISLHCSKTQDGKPILGPEAFKFVKSGAYLINCARGGLIDENALYQSLAEGRLSGAALDVYASEPYSGPLSGFDNVILLPHVGSYAREARIRMEVETIKNLISALKE